VARHRGRRPHGPVERRAPLLASFLTFDVRHDSAKHYIDTWSWGKPWSAMGRIGVPLYPFCIALGFMIPLDLCFSLCSSSSCASSWRSGRQRCRSA